MKKICRMLTSNWYWLLFAAVVLGEAAVFLFFGEGSYIATHDNLDLFMGHFQAMKHWNAFFGHIFDTLPHSRLTAFCTCNRFSRSFVEHIDE